MSLRDEVRQRAGDRCEYCRLPASGGTVSFHADHVIPRFHGGGDEIENRAWACAQCNRYKGTNLTGIDPESQLITVLFDPRNAYWNDHFALNNAYIDGVTAVGRTTVRTLRFNDEERVEFREVLIEKGEW